MQQAHAVWHGRRWYLQGILRVKSLGPELRIWHKIGYTICILLITLLWLAELIILPHQSTWTMPIVNTICGIGQFANKAEKLFESFYWALFTNICLPVMELLFQYIPLMTITMLLYFASSTFYFVNECLWWIPYIKIWWYRLSWGRRSFCEIIRNPNPHEHARPKYSHDCSINVWTKQKYINKKWVIRTQRFNCIARKILQFSFPTFGYYPQFMHRK